MEPPMPPSPARQLGLTVAPLAVRLPGLSVDMPTAKPIVIMGAGPAGLTAAWKLVNAWSRGGGVGGRRVLCRGHFAHGAGRRLSLRHRRPPLFQQIRRGQPRLAPAHAGRLHRVSAAVAHFLQGQVLQLSARGDERVLEPRGWSRRSAFSGATFRRGSTRCGRS